MELVLGSPVAFLSILALALLCGVGGYVIVHFLRHGP